MKAEGSKLCPGCGTRNRAKWDFCARCGESLQDVAVAAEAPAPTVVVSETAPSGSAAGLATSLLLVVAAVAFTVIWWQRTASAPPTPVDPQAFQFPTLPPAPPPRTAEAPSADADFDLGRRLLAQGDAAAAARAFAAALERRPDDPEVHSFYAQALFASGQRELGLTHFEQAARLSSLPKYRLGLAAALNMAGRSQEAVAQYEQVLAQDASEAQALKELGSLLNRLGRFEQAVAHLSRAAELQPTDVVLQQDLAWAQEAGGQLDQAAETYRRVLAAAPQASVSRARLAEVLLKQKKLDEALAVVEDGLRGDAVVPLLKRARASLLERSGRLAEAIAEYRDYARIAPNADDARVITERANQLEKRTSSS
jgi:tetratricopeptide (TPR) repeat protein